MVGAVRLEFPILSGESAPPVWRQPNVDHVGSWRARAPGRTVAACVQRALLDSHPVSAKRPEDGGYVHTIVRVGASRRCCCRPARRERSASRRMRRRISSPDGGVRSGRAWRCCMNRNWFLSEIGAASGGFTWLISQVSSVAYVAG